MSPTEYGLTQGAIIAYKSVLKSIERGSTAAILKEVLESTVETLEQKIEEANN